MKAHEEEMKRLAEEDEKRKMKREEERKRYLEILQVIFSLQIFFLAVGGRGRVG